MTFDQLVLSIYRNSSVKPLHLSNEINVTFTSRGCCTSAQSLLSLLTHTLTLCLPLFHEYLLCWWSKAAALRAVLVCAYQALFWGENSLQRTQIHNCSKQRCDTLRSSHVSLRCGPPGAPVEKLFAAVRGHGFSTTIIHRRCWTSVFLIDNWHRISRNWSSFTAASLSCIDANGGADAPHLMASPRCQILVLNNSYRCLGEHQNSTRLYHRMSPLILLSAHVDCNFLVICCRLTWQGITDGTIWHIKHWLGLWRAWCFQGCFACNSEYWDDIQMITWNRRQDNSNSKQMVQHKCMGQTYKFI